MKAIYFPRAHRQRRATKLIHLDAAGQEAFEYIYTTLCNLWRLESKPSISLLLQGVVIEYARGLRSDPNALKELVAEIKVRCGVTTKEEEPVNP